jgi:hypothetical protein
MVGAYKIIIMYKVFSVFLRVTKGSHNGKQGIVRIILVVCLFLTLLFNAGVSWGQSPTNGGFENGTTGWTSNGSLSTSNARTGANSLLSASSTSNSNTAHTNSATISIPTGNYAHVIGWAIGSNSFANASVGGTLNTTTSSSSTANIGTTLTRLTAWNVQNNSGSSQSFSCRVNSRSSASGNATQVYFDDVIMYTDAVSSADITKPVMPTTFTNGTIIANSATFSWTNGLDAGTGIQNTIILRTANLSAATPVMNDQGVYSTAGGTSGPNTVGSDWTILSTSVSAGATAYTDASVSAGTSYKYAIVHRDLAYNYSTALVSSNIVVPSPCSTPSITLVSKTNVTCHGGSNGAIDLTVSAGTALWSDASTTVDRAGLSAGTYSVTITDGACASTASYTITQPTAIVPSASSNGPLCAGSTLVLSSSATGGSGTYSTYVWSGPNSYTSSNQQNTILSATTAATGIYTITVTDNAGCTKTSSTTVSVNALPTVSVSPSASSMCAGEGAITLTASNAITYSWLPTSGLNTSSAATVNASPSSTTTYTVTASNGVCSNTATAVIMVNQHTTTGSVTTTACNSYLWAANGLTYTASGVYTVTSTNAEACINTATLDLTINQSNNSSTSLTAIGQSIWHGTTYTASGTYYNYTTGLTNCADTATLILTVTPACSITLNAVVDQSISCYGFNNGSIQAQAAPTGLYTYTIDGGTATNTTGFFANITPGLHTVCASDGICSLCQTVVMTEPDLLTVNFLTDSTVSCVGNDGALTAIVTGGTATIQPYLTTWSNGVNANSLYALSATGLSAVTYTITVEDDRQCFATATATIDLTPAVSVSATNSIIACFGGTSTISTTASGGTGTISTTISGGSFTVTAGTYTITATDTKGCTGTTVITINQPLQLANSSNVIVCTSYIFNGITYTNSGVYTHTLTSAAGCDSIHTLNLTVHNITSMGDSTITACDSYTWNGATYTTSGLYTFTSLNAFSCVNTATLYLTINNSSTSSSAATSCNSYTWNCTNATYTQSGAYTCTSLNAAGCVHTATLNLTINSSTTSSSSATACDSYTWTCTNATYTQSGAYACTYLNEVGCVHTATLNLTINNSSTSISNVTSCDTYTWNCNNVTYTTSGSYTCTSLNAFACVNSATLHLTINNSSTSSSSVTACDSYTWNCNNSTYTQSGAYTCTLLNAAGCVHTATLNLTINSSTTSSSSATDCDNYTWNCTNATFTQSGAYACTYLNEVGCVHTATLNLTINNSSTSISNVTSCDSYTWNCNNVTYTTSGSYTCTSLNVFSCVNSATLHLTINNSSTSSSSVTACDSYTWNCNNETYMQAGAYVCASLNEAGCVNTATLNLAINSSSTSSVSAQGSNSYTWPCNNITYVLSGVYTCTSLNSYGCVNTASLTLTIFNTTSNTTTASACDSYTWPYTNQSYSNSGIYTVTSLNTLGNLHVEILNLNVNYSSASSSSATACDSYTWNCNNTTVTNFGVYTCTFLNASGCVHTSTLNLTVNYSSTSSSSATACDSYTWSCNNITYSNSGSYTCTFLNASGCVHTSTLNLTVNYSSTSSSSATACDSYTWTCNNITYTNSGIYTCTFLNASGCVHTSTLDLTINNSSTSSSSATACDSYTWTCNNITYSNSGSYTCTFLNASGCVHTSTLNLTVNYSSVSSSSETACDSYTWNCNNATYSNSGIYTCTFLNASGCVHTSTLDLTINNSSASSSTVTSCDSYNWNCNNATYTNSGIYTCTFLNASGCVHTSTLNLTVNYSSTSSSSETACDSYTWNCNNVTYTNSGSYTCTYLNASGCVHTSTLNLTINYSSVSSSSATACDSYTWNCNNATYTNSGIYTCTFLNASGCVHTSTLHLTVNYSSTSSSTVTSCDSYEWNCNNGSYTNSGIYVCTYLNASGCLHTATLNLTVNYSSTSSLSATACDSYTWNCNNGTYTISGAYTCTTLNASGCVNTATLNATIRYSNTGNSPMTQCYNYTWNGTTYTLSGNYPHTYQNISGCDSVHTLNLIIHYSNSGSSNLSICDTYTWNGITYTTSGVYLHTYSNVFGCDSVHTLNLTIRRSNSGASALTKCDSYGWNNGVTYTTSGIYLHTYTNIAGCDSLHTLNLTVHYSNTGASSAVTCDTLTWRGTVYTLTGVYTKTFTNVVGCDSVHYLNLTVNYSTHNVINKDTCETYTWATGTGVTYTVSGTYLYHYINEFNCASTDTLKLDVRVKVSVKVFLAGPYDATTGWMSDSLRISRLTSTTPPTSMRLIPSLNPYGNAVPPYGNAAYPAIGYAGGDTVSQAILAVTGANAIVDWVLLELRNSSSPATVIANKRALIQRDGDVVSATDGVSPVAFSDTLKPGNFYVSIKHRNHMGIMSANAPRLNGCSTVFDFTSASGAAVWTNSSITANAPRKQFGSVYALWPADANSNKNVKYNGLIGSDKTQIQNAVGSSTLNNSLENVYRKEDVNMDGKVRYNNADNDRNVVLITIGVNTPNKVFSQHTPN